MGSLEVELEKWMKMEHVTDCKTFGLKKAQVETQVIYTDSSVDHSHIVNKDGSFAIQCFWRLPDSLKYIISLLCQNTVFRC